MRQQSLKNAFYLPASHFTPNTDSIKRGKCYDTITRAEQLAVRLHFFNTEVPHIGHVDQVAVHIIVVCAMS